MKRRLAAAARWAPFGAASFPALAWLTELFLERAATRALGLPVRVGPVRTRRNSGEFEISRIAVANPPGFREPHLLEVARARGSLRLATLGSEVIRVPRLELEHVELVLEQSRHGSNYGAVLRGFGGPDGSGREDAAGPGLVIGELSIRDLRTRIRFASGSAERSPFEVEIAELRFDEVGSDGPKLLVGGRFLQLLVGGLVRAVLAKGDRLPGLLARDLAEQLTSLGALWPFARRASEFPSGRS